MPLRTMPSSCLSVAVTLGIMLECRVLAWVLALIFTFFMSQELDWHFCSSRSYSLFISPGRAAKRCVRRSARERRSGRLSRYWWKTGTAGEVSWFDCVMNASSTWAARER